MALPDILAALEAEGDAAVRRIAEQSQDSIAQIRRAAEQEAAAIRERRCQDAESALAQERARRVNRARLAALRAASQARETLFRQALERARARLAALRADPAYPALLAALADEALAQIEGEAVLHADPRDECAMHARFPGVCVAYDLVTWGGVEARTLDGCITVTNTLEARLEQAEGLLRQRVMEWLTNTPMPG